MTFVYVYATQLAQQIKLCLLTDVTVFLRKISHSKWLFQMSVLLQ